MHCRVYNDKKNRLEFVSLVGFGGKLLTIFKKIVLHLMKMVYPKVHNRFGVMTSRRGSIRRLDWSIIGTRVCRKRVYTSPVRKKRYYLVVFT